MERNESFTPGPWTLETVRTSIGACHKIGPFPSNGPHKEGHACVYADGEDFTNARLTSTGKELLANARLIAAAPTLLESLRGLVANSTRADWPADLYDAAESAIALATSANLKEPQQ